MPSAPQETGSGGGQQKGGAKKKEKIIEDKTFGLKNKKGAKQQKFIKAVTHQVKFGQQNPCQVAQSEAEKKLKKDDKKKELQELNELLKPVVAAQKISKGSVTAFPAFGFHWACVTTNNVSLHLKTLNLMQFSKSDFLSFVFIWFKDCLDVSTVL
uniref:Uncharacterized protein n=1 Tax=Cavia porcellus TaxID=10141 RepID=A0A286XAW5_CAVPO